MKFSLLIMGNIIREGNWIYKICGNSKNEEMSELPQSQQENSYNSIFYFTFLKWVSGEDVGIKEI